MSESPQVPLEVEETPGNAESVERSGPPTVRERLGGWWADSRLNWRREEPEGDEREPVPFDTVWDEPSVLETPIEDTEDVFEVARREREMIMCGLTPTLLLSDIEKVELLEKVPQTVRNLHKKKPVYVLDKRGNIKSIYRYETQQSPSKVKGKKEKPKKKRLEKIEVITPEEIWEKSDQVGSIFFDLFIRRDEKWIVRMRAALEMISKVAKRLRHGVGLNGGTGTQWRTDLNRLHGRLGSHIPDTERASDDSFEGDFEKRVKGVWEDMWESHKAHEAVLKDNHEARDVAKSAFFSSKKAGYPVREMDVAYGWIRKALKHHGKKKVKDHGEGEGEDNESDEESEGDKETDED